MMTTKPILLAYATRFGSTQEVAETIAAVLRQAGLEVDIKPMQEVTTLNPYEAVVMGAAIYNTKWHKNAHQFLTQHQNALEQLPVAIFTLGPLSSSESAKQSSRRQLDKELGRYPWLKPVALEVFAGKYDPTKPGMGVLYRLLPTRDYRNWDSIRAWARALSAQFENVETVRFA